MLLLSNVMLKLLPSSLPILIYSLEILGDWYFSLRIIFSKSNPLFAMYDAALGP